MSGITWRRGAFFLSVLLSLALAGLLGVVVTLTTVVMGMSHHSLAVPDHRIHDLTYMFLNGTAAIGMLAQLRAPRRNVAGQLMAMVPLAALFLAAAPTNTWVLTPPLLLVGATTVLATMFHPIGDPLRAFAKARFDRPMLALTGVAAVPLLAFAWTNMVLQRAGLSEHAVMGHYGDMAAFSFMVIGVGILSSLRPDGWRLTAWVAGGLPAALAVASLLNPGVESSLSLPWAIAAISWGLAFGARAELVRRQGGGPGLVASR
jgi:hypothetical protein